MFEQIKSRRSEYSRQIEMRSNELERAKMNNAKLERLQSLAREADRVLHVVTEYYTSLECVETAVIREAKEYQNRRVDHLNAVITEAVNEIFPNDDYVAKLNCEYLRSDSARLRLVDKYGNEHIPAICEGKCMQYVISFASVSAITKGLGCNALFVDEAFGVANVSRMSDIGKLIQKNIDSDMQLVLIAQNNALYNELQRHEIHLHTEYVSDSETGHVIVTKEVDV